MKYGVVLIGIVGAVPLAFFLRANPFLARKTWLLIGVLPFLSTTVLHSDVALIPWDNSSRGYVFGLQISIIDLIALALYFNVMHKANSIRFHFPFLLYVSAISLSVFQSEIPLHTAFYIWQFVRIYFLAFVVSKACTDPEVAVEILKGMAIGLAIQPPVILWQVLVQHAIQPSGTFVHQNILGVITHLVIFPHWALLLAGQRSLRTALTPPIGMLVAAMTASRATLAFSTIGFAITLVFSAIRKLTPWKTRLAGLGALFLVGLAPVAFIAFEKRFAAEPLREDQYDERAAFSRAALMILKDYPLGVGANNYSFVAANYGYSLRAGVAPNEANLETPVHNAYLLTAAETGYFGVFAFVTMLFFPLVIAFRYGWRDRGLSGDLLLGLGLSLLLVYAHSLVEYVLLVKEVQYLLALVFGMVFGLAHRVKDGEFTPDTDLTGELEVPRSIINARQQSAGRLLR